MTIPAETITLLENAKKEGRRIIAVGTTSMRSLESYAAGKLKPIQSTKYKVQKWEIVDSDSKINLGNSVNSYSGDTNLYITP